MREHLPHRFASKLVSIAKGFALVVVMLVAFPVLYHGISAIFGDRAANSAHKTKPSANT